MKKEEIKKVPKEAGHMPQKICELLILATITLLMCASCTKVVRESDIFYPSKEKYPMISDVVLRENVEIAVEDSILLRGWYLTSTQNRRAIIYFYGNAERVEGVMGRLYWLAENLKLNVLVVDYRGYGFSDGFPTGNTLLADGLRIYDYLTSHLQHENFPIFIYGRSLGSTVGSYIAANRPVSGVILEGAFTSASDMIPALRRFVPWYFRWFVRLRPEKALTEKHMQPVENIRSVSAPLLVIHGTKDELAPVRFGRRIYEEAGSMKKHWCPVEGAGHNDLKITTGPALDSLRMFIQKYNLPK